MVGLVGMALGVIIITYVVGFGSESYGNERGTINMGGLNIFTTLILYDKMGLPWGNWEV